MPNNRIVAKDCLVHLVAIQNPNWLDVAFVDPMVAGQDPNAQATYLTRNLSIEGGFETVDVTGVAGVIVSNVETKYDTRITMSRLVPVAAYATGGRAFANMKTVPKDVLVTLRFYNNTPSFRSGFSDANKVDLVLETLARSVEISFRTENTRVDAAADPWAHKRPIRVDGRMRLEGLLLYPSVAADLNYHFIQQEASLRRVVKAEVVLPIPGGTGSYVYTFIGGLSRVTTDIDNPARQSLELVSIGYGGTTGFTGTVYDPLINLFATDANNLYTHLAFAVAVQIPSTTTKTTLKGNYGVEELTLSISETEVVANLTGVAYNDRGLVIS